MSLLPEPIVEEHNTAQELHTALRRCTSVLALFVCLGSPRDINAAVCSVPSFTPIGQFQAGGYGGIAAIGDFNADGKPDLAVGDGDPSGKISVLLATGDGTFRSVVGYPA